MATDLVTEQPTGETPPVRRLGGRLGGRRFWLLTGAVATGVVLTGYGLTAWALSGKAPRGTTVAGLTVGGLERAAASAKLLTAERALAGSLPVIAGGETAAVDLAAAGLALDGARTTAQFTGFSLNPARLWRHVGGGRDFESLPRPSDEQLDGALKVLAAAVQKPATEAGVEFDGATPELVSGAAGVQLAPAAAGIVRDRWLAPRKPLELPTAPLEPTVTRDAAQQALDGIATRAVSAPLTLVIGKREVRLTPKTFAPALSVVPGTGGALGLAVDGEKLRDAVLKQEPEIGKAPRDAAFDLKNGKPVVIPGVDGVSIDPASLGRAVVPALTGDDRRAEVRTKVSEPELTTAEAKKLGVKERVSTFSTILTADAGRTENLRIAARTVDGTVVLPGESFSLNGVLGKRTPEKGYNPAPAISGGRLVSDYGGGVSQMATTIFNNVFFAGLEDIYHKPHSFYISRYPEGREATVNYPTVDLKWRNDSRYAVLIAANVTDTVDVSFYSTKVWDVTASKGARTNFRAVETIYDDAAKCSPQAPNGGGFDVTVTRTMRRQGESAVAKKQTWKTSYIPEDRIICGKKPETR